MIKSIIKAYKGGWRAGMAEPRLVTYHDIEGGYYTLLAEPVNPYTSRRQPLHAFAWSRGEWAGTFKRLAKRN